MKEGDEARVTRRTSGYLGEPAIQVICLGAGGGPSEDNVTGFLIRSTASQWAKNSVLAVDAGTHLSAITRILEKDFSLVSSHLKPLPHALARIGNGTGDENDSELLSPTNANLLHSDSDSLADSSGLEEDVVAPIVTTLDHGPFAGLSFPHASARANALHVVREHVSTYLITHPHLDHVSGFVINTAAFHNTSKPKRLAALPFTVNAIKTHLFNNIVWPNLTDEDGGVGLVTFQRLTEGGNNALGEGSGRGYIEVSDGLRVKGFKVSHGHCMRGPTHVHRGSNANLPETPGIHAASHGYFSHGGISDSVNRVDSGRSMSFSLPSAPGTPLYAGGNATTTRRGSIGPAPTQTACDQCVIDSSAYFIRTEASSHTTAREVLIFGDVEPDSISLSPRTAMVWAEAAPKIAAGILTGIFIECSYNNSQADAVLYGHLGPRHLLQELAALADRVREARRDYEREKEELRKGRKRKRASNGLLGGATVDGTLLEATGARKASRTRSYAPGKEPEPSDDIMADFAPSPTPGPGGARGGATDSHTPLRDSHPSAPAALNLSSVSAEHTKALLSAANDAPLKGVKVVVIHVKDTLADGPPVGESILQQLLEGERQLAEQGKGLGCVFEVSRSGGSYFF